MDVSKVQGSLIERARFVATMKGAPAPLLEELAGEVDRCWNDLGQHERNAKMMVQQIEAQGEAIRERDAKIKELQDAPQISQDALNAAWSTGYHAGANRFVAAFAPLLSLPDPTIEPHSHEGHTHGPQESH